MTNIINLNKARKTKARADKEQCAEENRTKFGRTKAEKSADHTVRNKQRQHSDSHKIEKDSD